MFFFRMFFVQKREIIRRLFVEHWWWAMYETKYTSSFGWDADANFFTAKTFLACFGIFASVAVVSLGRFVDEGGLAFSINFDNGAELAPKSDLGAVAQYLKGSPLGFSGVGPSWDCKNDEGLNILKIRDRESNKDSDVFLPLRHIKYILDWWLEVQLLSLAGIKGISTCSTSCQNLVQYRWILDHWGLGFLVQRRGSMPWKQSVCQEVQL